MEMDLEKKKASFGDKEMVRTKPSFIMREISGLR